jgi:hypothetical protein
MYISDLLSNNMTINYCIRTVKVKNVQLKTSKPIIQRDINVKLSKLYKIMPLYSKKDHTAPNYI